MVQVKTDATPPTLLLTLPIRCSISLLCATHLPTTSGRGDCERLQDGDATRLRSTICQLRLGLKAGLVWVDVALPTLLAKRTACGIEPRGTFKSAGIVRARSNVESRKENRSVFGSIVGFTSTSAWLSVSYCISVYFCACQIRSRKMRD